MVLMAAAGLGAVVVEEHQAQQAGSDRLRTICWSEIEDPRDATESRSGSRACTETRAARAPRR
jgi:hypothetical protein